MCHVTRPHESVLEHICTNRLAPIKGFAATRILPSPCRGGELPLAPPFASCLVLLASSSAMALTHGGGLMHGLSLAHAVLGVEREEVVGPGPRHGLSLRPLRVDESVHVHESLITMDAIPSLFFALRRSGVAPGRLRMPVGGPLAFWLAPPAGPTR